MKEKKRKIDRTLLELMTGILLFGILCQLTVVWLVEDRGGYSLGLWLGVLLAEAVGFHMWWSLDRALDLEQEAAVKMMTKHNILRYLTIVVCLGVIMTAGIANPLAAFLGLMGLKVSAYLQPFTHKLCAGFDKEVRIWDK